MHLQDGVCLGLGKILFDSGEVRAHRFMIRTTLQMRLTKVNMMKWKWLREYVVGVPVQEENATSLCKRETTESDDSRT